MAKAIGPNFSNELAAANVLGLSFSWLSDGTIQFGAAMTAPQIAAVQAVYAAHDPATPDPRAQYNQFLSEGLTIQSTGTPALNGTYAIDDAAQKNISGIAAGVASRNRVPGGGATFDYPDIAFQDHAFTAQDFLNFSAAVEDAIYNASRGNPPVQPVTIA